MLLKQHSLASLRLGTFCAERSTRQCIALRWQLTPNYINSYWATEHGGIVWSRCHDNVDQQLPTRAVGHSLG